jgi:hypothetical protein
MTPAPALPEPKPMKALLALGIGLLLALPLGFGAASSNNAVPGWVQQHARVSLAGAEVQRFDLQLPAGSGYTFTLDHGVARLAPGFTTRAADFGRVDCLALLNGIVYAAENGPNVDAAGQCALAYHGFPITSATLAGGVGSGSGIDALDYATFSYFAVFCNGAGVSIPGVVNTVTCFQVHTGISPSQFTNWISSVYNFNPAGVVYGQLS